MTLVASEGDTEFTVEKGAAAAAQSFYYSINGGKWSKVNFDNSYFNVAHGGNIRFKSKTFISSVESPIRFDGNMPFSITGNIMSLGYFDDAKGKTSIGDNMYSALFTTSRVRHVDANFLPATSLYRKCYYSMFENCRLLESAPTLPATVLEVSCYEYMFYGCSKLNYIKMLATDITASRCLTSWVSGVSSTGTFVKNPAMTSLPSGSSGIPRGWAVMNVGEE